MPAAPPASPTPDEHAPEPAPPPRGIAGVWIGPTRQNAVTITVSGDHATLVFTSGFHATGGVAGNVIAFADDHADSLSSEPNGKNAEPGRMHAEGTFTLSADGKTLTQAWASRWTFEFDDGRKMNMSHPPGDGSVPYLPTTVWTRGTEAEAKAIAVLHPPTKPAPAPVKPTEKTPLAPIPARENSTCSDICYEALETCTKTYEPATDACMKNCAKDPKRKACEKKCDDAWAKAIEPCYGPRDKCLSKCPPE